MYRQLSLDYLNTEENWKNMTILRQYLKLLEAYFFHDFQEPVPFTSNSIFVSKHVHVYVHWPPSEDVCVCKAVCYVLRYESFCFNTDIHLKIRVLLAD